MRLINRIFACLLIGVTASVAVAWACWMWPVRWRPCDPNPQMKRPAYLWWTNDPRIVDAESAMGGVSFGSHMAFYSMVDKNTRFLVGPRPAPRAHATQEEHDRYTADMYSDVVDGPKYAPEEWYQRWTASPVEVVASGWPAYCLASVDELRFIAEPLSWARPRRWFARPMNQGGYALPTTVIPLGLALNTLFYASIAAVPVLLVPALRRRHRRLRGRCVACGYTLAGLPTCPECGVAASPRVLPA
jgi:hypothetical protein